MAEPLLACALCAGSLSANSLTVTFSGSGQVTGPAQTPPLLTQLEVLPGTSAYTFAGVSGWTLSSIFSFNAATLTGSGAGTYAQGSDSLAVTFTSATAALGEPLFLALTVTGGTGIYANLVGSGTSQVQLLGNPLGLPTPIPFLESNGLLTLSPIPEPASALLLILGLAGLTIYRLTWEARRRLS